MNESKVDLQKVQSEIEDLKKQVELLKMSSDLSEGLFEIIRATPIYHELNDKMKFIDLEKLDFEFDKYFIEEVQPRSSKLKSNLSPALKDQLLSLIAGNFCSQNYLTVIENDSRYHIGYMTRLLFQEFSKEQVGKITRINDFEKEHYRHELESYEILSDSRINATVNRIYPTVAKYQGHPMEGKNVLLINVEFGFLNEITNLIVALKPKKVLNLLFKSSNEFWFENVD